MIKVFVYGTLKRNYHNNSIIEKETFISEGFLSRENRFKMVSMGSFPAIIPAQGPESQDIEGEIWNLSEEGFKKVDILEGFPNFYWRDLFNIDTKEKRHLCWVYYLQHKKAKTMDLPEIPSRRIVNFK